MPICQTGVDPMGSARDQNFERTRNGTVNAKMTSEPVARTAGNEAQRGVGPDQRSAHLVHRAVASDCDNEFATFVERLRCDLGRMARTLRDFNPCAPMCCRGLDM